ncbi:MAG: hypothetical protein KDB26_13875 [Microthrixaceae bacterium]|nr:hypothetical protein [Microthrixaceae bacterium]
MTTTTVHFDGMTPVALFTGLIADDIQWALSVRDTIRDVRPDYQPVPLVMDTSISETITYDPARGVILWHPAHVQALRAHEGDRAVRALIEEAVERAAQHQKMKGRAAA